MPCITFELVKEFIYRAVGKKNVVEKSLVAMSKDWVLFLHEMLKLCKLENQAKCNQHFCCEFGLIV